MFSNFFVFLQRILKAKCKWKVFLIIFHINFLYGSDFLTIIEKEKLYESPYWLKLLHYENGKSTIITEEFFLSKDGNHNPKNELLATIKAFENNPQTMCKYPARYVWLNSKIDFHFSPQSCNDLDSFLDQNYTGIQLVFTTERYNSPATLFGHTFLKVTSSKIPYVIDYSATTANDITLVYAYKGIFGKYKSKYSLMPFSIKDFEYRNEEFRDLLYYDLKFTSAELKNILYHLYEIKDAQQDYYFFTHNCSSELIKLLDFADPNSNMQEDLNLVTLPVTILEILYKHEKIEKITQEISKLKAFYKNLDKLNKESMVILKQLTNNMLSVYQFQQLSLLEQDKRLIIRLAISYLEIKSLKDGLLSQKEINLLMALIDLELKTPLEQSEEEIISISQSPISAKIHKIYTEKRFSKNVTKDIFGYRHLYKNRFDMVDSEKKNGSVEVFDIGFSKIEDSLLLNHLTIVNLEALPLSNLFYRENTNKITLGLKRIFKDEELYGYFDYGVGFRYKFTDALDCSLYTRGSIYMNNNIPMSIALEPSCEFNTKASIMTEFKLILENYTNGFEENRAIFSNYIRIRKNTTMTVNISSDLYTDQNNQLGIKIAIYF